MVYVKEWLRHLGWKQIRLAREVGWSEAVLSKHIRGWTDWNEPKIVAAAAALGLTPCDLFRRPDELSIDAIIRDLPDNVKQDVAAYAIYTREKFLSNSETSVDRHD